MDHRGWDKPKYTPLQLWWKYKVWGHAKAWFRETKYRLTKRRV